MANTKRHRVPDVLWKLYKNRAKTLAETILSFLPPPLLQCRCKRGCVRCCPVDQRLSFLLKQTDPSDYKKLLNNCFVVASQNAPSSTPQLDRQRFWSQIEFVKRTVEKLSSENKSTKNLLCTKYDKVKRSSFAVETLSSDSWRRLKRRVGDAVMFHLLKYYSIFIPQRKTKHQQVAGFPFNELCWEHFKLLSNSKNQQPSSAAVPTRQPEPNPVSKNIDIPESSTSRQRDSILPDSEITQEIEILPVVKTGKQLRSHARPHRKKRRKLKSQNTCNTSSSSERQLDLNPVSMNIDIPESSMRRQEDSVPGADFSQLSQEDEVLVVATSGKRSSSNAGEQGSKRTKLSSQNTRDATNSVPEERMNSPHSCCSVWKTMQKLPRKSQICKQSMLYKLERGSSILPGNNMLKSLKPNAVGANALFQDIFGFDNNGISAVKTTCLYQSLQKLLKIVIRRTIHCQRSKLLKKHIFVNGNQSDSSVSQASYSSKSQVVSFVWAVCRSIVPQELLGTPSNWRVLRKNIFKFISLRIHEKFSSHQCIHKLKTSNFPFLSNNNSTCNLSTKHDILERWIFWFFNCLVVPVLQANFYITESEHGTEVFFYETSIWDKMMKNSISCLKEKSYSLLDTHSLKKIVCSRTFGFSRVRFRPTTNGIQPLANLKSSSRLRTRSSYQEFKPVNMVLRDLHAVLKDVQVDKPDKLGSSVFSYNDVHVKLREFLTQIKSGGSNTLPSVYVVVADIQNAFDSIVQDKLLSVMNDVVTGNHLLHLIQEIVATKDYMHICQHFNRSRFYQNLLHAPTSHSIVVDQGITKLAKKVDLKRNLQQHVECNVLQIDKNFYQQKVGITQGSILSQLLCSFYYGHMENTQLLPFLNRAAETEISNNSVRHDLLFRFIDDFCFITTSKKMAHACYMRLQRGFSAYNCNMNKEIGFSFDIDNISPSSKRLYVDESGNKFLRWSGLFINCKTLEVQADYTRYLDGHLRSTLTVCMQGNPSRYLKERIRDYLQSKCHAIFYDSKINSAAVIRLNIHQAFLLCAMKFHCYVCDLSDICSFKSGTYMDIIHKSCRFMYKLTRKRMYLASLKPILKVKKSEVEWLGLTAYFQVLKRKQSRYKELLSLLESKLKSLNIKRVSPALEYAVDTSHSSLVWKIKY